MRELRSAGRNGLMRLLVIVAVMASSWHLLNASTLFVQQHSDALSEDAPMGWPQAAVQDANHDIQTLNNLCYQVGYSNLRANPLWVSYRVHRVKDGQVDKRPPKFLMDERTSARVVHEHYNRSGYTRGHMAPNHAIGELCNDAAQLETFMMTNIVPQTSALNSRWWERLERVELSHFTQFFKEVWVFSGPVFSANPVTLPHAPVQVPEHCYKIYVAQKGNDWHVLAFVVDQGVKGNEPLSNYVTTIENIEQLTGLSFLTSLPKEAQEVLKRSKADSIWQLNHVDQLPARY